MAIGHIFRSLSKAHKVALSGSTAVNSTDFATRLVMIWATTDCFIVFGSSSVTATADTPSIPIPAGTCLFVDTAGSPRVAGITTGGTGTLYIVECN